jgi:hypothetical protein
MHRRIKRPDEVRTDRDHPLRRQVAEAATRLRYAYGHDSPMARYHEKVFVFWARKAGVENQIEWEPWVCPTCGAGGSEPDEPDEESLELIAKGQRYIARELSKAGDQ